MNETAELLHHIPGRLRLRLEFAKGDAAELLAIRDSLSELAGVTQVDVNPVLGTALVRYDPELFDQFTGALIAYASEHELFSMAGGESAPSVSEADRSVNRIVGQMNRAVQTAMGNAINLKELLPLAIGAYGLLLVDRGAAAAQWLNWIQFAFDTYIDLHEGEPIAELGEKLESVGTEIIDRQAATTESLRAEVAALRHELRTLAERLTVQRAG